MKRLIVPVLVAAFAIGSAAAQGIPGGLGSA